MEKNYILIEKEVFYQMLEHIDKLVMRIEDACEKYIVKDKEWLDAQDVCIILNIKPRTLKSYRDNGKIGFTQIEKKIFYKDSEIQKLLKDHKLKNSSL